MSDDAKLELTMAVLLPILVSGVRLELVAKPNIQGLSTSRNHHPELSDIDIIHIPSTVDGPTYVGVSQSKDRTRVWLLRQDADDRMALAVYGKKRGRLSLVTFYTREKGEILRQLKEKGVRLGAAGMAFREVERP